MKKLFLVATILIFSFNVKSQWMLNMQEGGNVYSLIGFSDAMFAGTQFGVYKSGDQGENWVQVNNGLTNTVVHSIIVLNDTLCAGTEDGVFISTDMGENWTAANTGMAGQKIKCLLPANNGLFAGTEEGGVFYNDHLNGSWAAKNNGITNLNIKTLAIKDNRLFAGSFGDGVFVSDDNGNSWSTHNDGLQSWFINFMIVRGEKVFLSSETTFCVSIDGGNNWSVVEVPFDARVLSGVNFEETMLLGTDGNGVAYSNDGGENWTLWNDGFTNYNIYSLSAIDNYYWAGCCCGYGLYQREISEITGTPELQSATKITLYPNPASDRVSIQTDDHEPAELIKVFNSKGTLVREVSKSNQLDISDYANGLYFLQIYSIKYVVTSKLVKK